MENIIPVEQVLSNTEAYANKIVTIEGRLMASFYDVSMVPLSIDVDTYDYSEKILIEHLDLSNNCFATISPWVGGRFYYHDKAIITGRFNDDYALVMCNLTNLKIIRGENEYTIALT